MIAALPAPDGGRDLRPQFETWAREHEPAELDALMPEGRLDPSGDHPVRMRALLERWRADAGLPPR